MIFRFAVLLTTCGIAAQVSADSGTNQSNRILVRYNRRLSQAEAVSSSSGVSALAVHRIRSVPGLQVVQLPQGSSVDAALKVYKDDPNVLYAEPDLVVHATDVTPNDTDFGQQWGLHNTGQSSGTVDIDMNMPQAWGTTLGDATVYVGVIDTGIDYTHPDLLPSPGGNIWVNPDETAANSIDDDADGFVDDIHGINAIVHNASPGAPGEGDPMDNNGHGTHVAGIMAAAGNNAEGISGVMQTATVISCKFLDSTGSGFLSDAISCLDYFTFLKNNKNLNIIAINNSWGAHGTSSALSDTVAEVLGAGILFIASAGNSSENNDGTDITPGNIDLPNVISVAAIDRNGNLASFSSFGNHSVAVAAPGVAIHSTIWPGHGYQNQNGTSMAAPHVTGLAGLIESSIASGSRVLLTDWIKIKNLILTGGKVLSPALDSITITNRMIRAAGAGTSNDQGALTCNNQSLIKRIVPRLDAASVAQGSSVLVRALNIDCALPLGELDVPIAGGGTLALKDDGIAADTILIDGVSSADWTPSGLGIHTLQFDSGADLVPVEVFSSSSWKRYGGISVPSTPDYEDISLSGTKVQLFANDDSVQVVQANFPIMFGDDSMGLNLLYISSNGTLSFTDAAPSPKQNDSLPDSSRVTVISPYWDDLVETTGDSGVFVASVGTSGSRRKVVEWRNMGVIDPITLDLASPTPVTFQIVFFEDSSDIEFNYLNTNIGDSSFDDGASATIGVQTTGSARSQFSFNSASHGALSGTSILFKTTESPSSGGGGGSTTTVTTAANNHPTSPILNSPDDNAVISADSATLQFGGATDPDNDVLVYNLVVDGTSAASALKPDSQGNVQYVLKNLLDGKTYTWSVTANDGNVDGPSAERKFSVQNTAKIEGAPPAGQSDVNSGYTVGCSSQNGRVSDGSFWVALLLISARHLLRKCTGIRIQSQRRR